MQIFHQLLQVIDILLHGRAHSQDPQYFSYEDALEDDVGVAGAVVEKLLVGESPVYPECWFQDLLGDTQVQVDNLFFAGDHGEFHGGMGAVQISLKVGQFPLRVVPAHQNVINVPEP